MAIVIGLKVLKDVGPGKWEVEKLISVDHIGGGSGEIVFSKDGIVNISDYLSSPVRYIFKDMSEFKNFLEYFWDKFKGIEVDNIDIYSLLSKGFTDRVSLSGFAFERVYEILKRLRELEKLGKVRKLEEVF